MAVTDGARTDHRFVREVNKRIRTVSSSLGTDGSVEVLCECGRPDCGQTLVLSEAQFDGLLESPHYLLLAAEHRSTLDGRRILAAYETFVIVAET